MPGEGSSTAFYATCEVCGFSGGPYTGTMWKTAREQAEQATGQHQTTDCPADPEVVERAVP